MPPATLHTVPTALEDFPLKAENMKMRARLLFALKEHLERSGLSNDQAGQVLQLSQGRIADLMKGRVNLFSLDTLINLAALAGMQVELKVAPLGQVPQSSVTAG